MDAPHPGWEQPGEGERRRWVRDGRDIGGTIHYGLTISRLMGGLPMLLVRTLDSYDWH